MNLIYYHRRKKKLTQEELASICECTQKTISNLENSEELPLIIKVAKALNKTVEELYIDID